MKKNPDYEAGFIRATGESKDAPEGWALSAQHARKHRKMALAVVAVAVIGAVAGGVVVSRRDTPARQLARAEAYGASNQHRAAIIELKRSLQGEPQQPRARFLLAHALTVLGDDSAAAIEYQKAIDVGYPRDQAIVPLIDSVLRQGRYDQVITAVSNASVESDAVNAALQTLLATADMALGKTEAGADAFTAAFDLVPDFPPALIAKARYFASRGRFDEANGLLDMVPPEVAQRDEVQSLRGDIARSRHRPQEAATAYENAVERHPEDMSTRLNLAEAYLDLDQLDKAQVQIGVVVHAAPLSGRAHFVAAMVAYLRKDLPAARAAITQAVQLVPGDGNAQLLAGVIALQDNDLIEAELHLRQGVQIVPQSLEGRRILADLYFQRHELAKAEETLRPVVDASPDDRDVAALAARIAMREGDAGKAARMFDRVGALKTRESTPRLVSASLRFAAGDPNAAFAQLEAAAKADPDDAEIDVALVINRLQRQQVELAQAAWQRLEAKQPDHARTCNLRALIAGARNDRVLARQWMEKALSLDPHYFQAVAGLSLLDVDEGKVDRARDRLRQDIAGAPHPVPALLLLARIEGAHGAAVETVAALLDQAEKSDPRSEAVINDAIAFHASHDRQDLALADVQRGLLFAPNNQFYLYTAGSLFQKFDRTGDALAAFAKLTALNSENVDFLIRLGQTQVIAGKTEEALRSFREVLKRTPNRTDLQIRMMSAFLGAPKLDEARRLLFEISQASPNSPLLREYEGDIRMARKEFADAIAIYRQALAVAPNSRLLIKTASAYDAAKLRNEGTTLLTDWLRTRPNDELVAAFDGQRAIDNKDDARALERFRRLVDSHPNDPRLLNALAWVLARRNDPRALDIAEKAAGLAPDDADVGDTLGVILVQQGQVARGIDLIAKASTRAPARLEIKVHLAKAQLGEGRKAAARANLEAVVSAAPASAEGRESRTLLETL